MNLRAYEATEDVGFNNHGCRNLMMMESETHWNMLMDIDYDLQITHRQDSGIWKTEFPRILEGLRWALIARRDDYHEENTPLTSEEFTQMFRD